MYDFANGPNDNGEVLIWAIPEEIDVTLAIRELPVPKQMMKRITCEKHRKEDERIQEIRGVDFHVSLVSCNLLGSRCFY